MMLILHPTLYHPQGIPWSEAGIGRVFHYSKLEAHRWEALLLRN